MRRIYLLFLAFIILTSGCNISACRKESRQKDTTGYFQLDNFNFDEEGDYTGFDNLPRNYTEEEAIEDGYLVFESIEMVGGEDVLKQFKQNVQKGKNAGIRIAKFYDDENAFIVNYKDLFYLNGFFRCFDSDSTNLKDNKYEYMLELIGTLPNAAKSGKLTILTDDKLLSYLDVEWAFLSSNSHYAESISSFQLLHMEVLDGIYEESVEIYGDSETVSVYIEEINKVATLF